MAELQKKLTTSGLAMIAIGACIGSGIFITPANTIATLPHYGLALVPWVLGGVATYFGALSFAELSVRYPQAGGVYVYLKEAYGPLWGFLYGWVTFFIINTGALAALSMAFADFLSFFFEISSGEKTAVAISTILLLTLLNSLGVGLSQQFSRLFSSLKLFSLGMLILFGLYLLFGSESSHFQDGLAVDIPGAWLGGILISFVGVFWSFGGWHHITYLSGEAIEPARSVPKGMLYGTMVVTTVYILVILAYMVMIPMDQIIASSRVAGDALAAWFPAGGQIVALAITVSVFGTIGIYTMSAPRIYFAMAKDGLFFQSLARIHPRFRTPHLAMWSQAIWACLLLIFYGSFIKIITFVTFMDIVFMALACGSLFVFRHRAGVGAALSYQTPGYPWIPGIYLLITVAFVFYALFLLNAEALMGVAILLLGIPVFFWYRRRSHHVDAQ